eukprot:9243280-Alexandrium_andersonii.AAC.1
MCIRDRSASVLQGQQGHLGAPKGEDPGCNEPIRQEQNAPGGWSPRGGKVRRTCGDSKNVQKAQAARAKPCAGLAAAAEAR